MCARKIPFFLFLFFFFKEPMRACMQFNNVLITIKEKYSRSREIIPLESQLTR